MKRLRAIQCLALLVSTLLAGQTLAAERNAVLDWAQYWLLSTPVSGVVSSVNVKPGEQVKPKQTLLRLDARGFQARVKKAGAVLKRAQETYKEAKREIDRAQELFDRTAISVHERELVRIEYSKADAGLKEAQADLTQAKLDLEYSVIRAPGDALVVQVYAYPGQTVINRLQATPLLALASQSRMIARAQLVAKELQGLKPGMQVDVRVAGQAFTGKVSHLGLEPLDQQTPVRYALEVEFAGTGQDYRKGQAAVIVLP